VAEDIVRISCVLAFQRSLELVGCSPCWDLLCRVDVLLVVIVVIVLLV